MPPCDVFEIHGYSSLLGRIGAGEFVQSAAFEAGGYDRAVRYYPHGCSHASPAGYASVFVELTAPAAAEAPASCETAKVEQKEYLAGDVIKIQGVVTIFKEPTNSGARRIMVTSAVARVGEVPPPPELPGDLARLLYTKEGEGSPPPADVTVFVGGEAFAAHRVVLWARCPKLYDQVTAWGTVNIFDFEVQQPAVFRALLHYIYTDSLPAMDELDAVGELEMLKGVLAAAHRYRVERLKLICERALSTRLDAGTVVATLALAEQLGCTALRGACLQFICSTEKRSRSVG
nr:unnamed protein product [Digitaria exilis]